MKRRLAITKPFPFTPLLHSPPSISLSPSLVSSSCSPDHPLSLSPSLQPPSLHPSCLACPSSTASRRSKAGLTCIRSPRRSLSSPSSPGPPRSLLRSAQIPKAPQIPSHPSNPARPPKFPRRRPEFIPCYSTLFQAESEEGGKEGRWE